MLLLSSRHHPKDSGSVDGTDGATTAIIKPEMTPHRPEPERTATAESLATRRARWATRKLTVKRGQKQRANILSRHANAVFHHEKKPSSVPALQSRDQANAPKVEQQQAEPEEPEAAVPRKLYFNQVLPPDAQDEDGNPKAIFRRNKIRTAKYTPLSFIPKNLWFQFQNIANVFFLFLVILVVFPIFGGTNPGLNAVPLIVIIAATGLKDAIEDYRRTISDNKLNNAPVHMLHSWNNVNVKQDNISTWRKIKKATSHGIAFAWRALKHIWKPEVQVRQPKLDDEVDNRNSVDTRFTMRSSMARSNRTSFVSARESFRMTPLASPLPVDSKDKRDYDLGGGLFNRSGEQPARDHTAQIKGDVINRDLDYGRAKFKKDAWKNVRVGDFVRIYNNDELPADIIVLSTSDADGICYVETKNLDGETNLKVRNALRCSSGVRHARDCERAQFYIEAEQPQPNLYKFNGAIRWQQKCGSQMVDMSEPVTIDNVLLRGCNLRNTTWALGVVVYTGHDTKIMMNAGITPSKRSRIAREMNYTVIYNFSILVIICLISALINGAAWGLTNSSIAYFEFGSIGGTPVLSGFITFWAAVILFQNLVPISLYISLEIVRTLQAAFIYSDVEMYYEPIDQPCIPKSWNISDDVGQIEYIFSDKTGTLTQNVMEFKKASINGQPYGEAYTEAQAGMRKRLGVDVVKEAEAARADIARARVQVLKELREMHNNPFLHDEDLTFVAPDFVSDMHGDAGAEQAQANKHFMLALALCHTVIAEREPGEDTRITYKAQSPDEAALVATARDMGFTVLGSTQDGIDLNVMGQEIHYQVMNTIEFNSSRKRMSAIVRMPAPDNRIILFCKGADSIIYSRLKKGQQAELRKETAEHLELFAREGLRTLCIAQRVLSQQQYDEWRKAHDKAATALTDREEKMEEVADSIERELELLGGTAIEDCLQDGVPDTIELLGEAGIKLWVLTGDKVETAINIGFSCNLLNNDMELIHLKVDEGEHSGSGDGDDVVLSRLRDELDRLLAQFGLTGSDEDLKAARKTHEAPPPTHALIIDGFTLKWTLHDELKQKFLLLCKQCKSVLCCRVSPAQKASVVAMVKHGLDVMTLSIGDGANDVAMIQEADVGVGIAGVEGRQAVMSSDYAIGQFRFLQRLVLVHGRWSYRRLAETIPNFFYKNIIWVFAIFWYQIYCNYDMTYIFDYTYILMFNLLFTSVPVILMGVLDQDVSDKVSLAVPQLYRRGIERLEWTNRKFWLHMLDGFYQSIVSFFLPYLAFAGTLFVSKHGLDVSDRVRLGAYIAHAAVITINLYILMNTYRWDWLMLLVVILSDLCIFIWTGLYSSTEYSGVFYKAGSQVYRQPTFWAVTIITPICCLFPRFVIKVCQKVYFPYDVDIIREQVSQGKFDYLEHRSQREVVAPGMTKSGMSSLRVATDPSHGQAEVEPDDKGAYMQDAAAHTQRDVEDDERRPIYASSIATHTTATNVPHTRSENTTAFPSLDWPRGSRGGTSYDVLSSRPSTSRPQLQPLPQPELLQPHMAPPRFSIDRPRPSYDRMRASMDRVRPCFEASDDFTSAARLTRVESSHGAFFPRLKNLALHGKDGSKPAMPRD